MRTETHPHADRHRLMSEASLALSMNTNSIEDTLDHLAVAVAGFADRCSIHLMDEDGTAHLVALRDAFDPALKAPEKQLENTLTDRFMALTQAEILDQPEMLASLLALEIPIVSGTSGQTGLIVPMRVRTRTLGWITVLKPRADQDTFEALARLAAISVDAAQLHATQERSSRALARAGESAARLRNLAYALLEATSSQALAQVVIDQGFSGLGASFGVVSLLERGQDGEELRTLWANGQPDSSQAIPVSLREPLIDAAHGEAVWLESHKDWVQFYPRSAQARHIPSAFVALPLRLGRRAVGVLAFGFLNARRFPSEARHFLLELARQCAGALERTELIQNLETERANLEAVLRQMPSAVVIAEAPSGKLLLANRQVEEIWRQPFQMDSGQHRGTPEIWQHWLGFKPGGEPLEVERWPLARAIGSGETVMNEEIEILRGDGSWGAISANAAPILGPHGQVIAGVMAFSDVTERVRAERELRELNMTLEKRVEERTHELELRNAEMESFVYTASHDLRSPLLAVQSLTYLLETALKNDDQPKAFELVGRINRRVERISRLLEDLLTLSKVGLAQDEREQFDFGEIVYSVLGDLEPQMQAVRMKVDMPKTWPRVTYTRSQAYQLVLNLISNAMKYGGRPGIPPRAELSWAVAAGEQHVIVRVKDNGPGIPVESRERVFGLFHKLDANSNGTGVGLAIVKRIAERHGGRVWIEGPPPSTIGPVRSSGALRLPNFWGSSGATFAVTVPVAEH